MAELDKQTKTVITIIRDSRKEGLDEVDLTDYVVKFLIETFSKYEAEVALLGAMGALSRALVLLSRTNIFDESDPLI